MLLDRLDEREEWRAITLELSVIKNYRKTTFSQVGSWRSWCKRNSANCYVKLFRIFTTVWRKEGQIEDACFIF